MMTRTTLGILGTLLFALLVAWAAAESPGNTTINGSVTVGPGATFSTELLWQETYGADSNTRFLSLLPGAKDEYMLVGVATSNGDLVLARVNRTGALLDQHRVSFSPGGGGTPAAVSLTPDDGLLVAGSARSVAPGDEDVALLRLRNDGSPLWSRSFAIGSGVDRGTAVLPAMDGGFLVAGTTASPTGGSTDLLLLRVDEAGGKLWHRIHPLGAGQLAVSDLRPAPGGGYLLVGTTDSGRPGTSAVILMRLTADGSKAWQQTYASGSGSARGVTLVAGSDGGYLLLAEIGAMDSTGSVLVNVDTDGRERWRVGLGSNASLPVLGHDLAVVGNHGYLVVGQNGSPEASRSLVTMVDRAGDEAWNHSWSVGGTAADRAGAVLVSGPDQYLVAGDTVSSMDRQAALYLAAIGIATVAPNITVNATPTTVETPAGNETSVPTFLPSTPSTTPVATTTAAPAGLVPLLGALSAVCLFTASRRR